MFVTFPFNVKFQTSGFHVVGASSAPQQGVGGAFSVQPRLGAHWIGAVTFMCTNEETTLAVEAFVASMEGMLGTTAVPVYQRYTPRDGQGRIAPQGYVAPLGDALQYEGAGSETAEFWGFEAEPAIYGTLSEAALLRAVQVKLTNTNAQGLRPGHNFGIGNNLHRAQQVWQDGGVDVVRFSPPLRADADAGAIVTMDAPKCLMRFSSEDEGQQVYSPTPVQSITMNFVEAI